MKGSTLRTARDITLRDRTLDAERGPLVCVPIIGRDRESILADAATAAGLAPDMIEWRADFFDGIARPGEALALLAEIREATGGVPLLFTIRSRREGGEPVALEDAGIAQLCVDVCGTGLAALVDFEMGAPGDHLRAVRAAARDSGTRLILSYHNFDATPDLAALCDRFSTAESLGGDIAKVAVTPQDLDDVLVLLTATLQASRETRLPLIGIAMGPVGALTRAIGWHFGSAVTFAAAGQSSAPGQLSVDAVREIREVLERHLPDDA